MVIIFNKCRRLLACCLAAALLLALAGCCRLSMRENVVGTWRSADGVTAVISRSTLTLTDRFGSPLTEEPLDYVVSGNYMFLTVGGESVRVFECRADGDTLELLYVPEFTTKYGDPDTSSIQLELCD